MTLANRWQTLLAALAILVAGAAGSPVHGTPRLPELAIEGPASHAGLIEMLESFDRGAFARAMELVGLADPGPPIRVVVAPEGTPAARRSPASTPGARSPTPTAASTPCCATRWPTC